MKKLLIVSIVLVLFACSRKDKAIIQARIKNARNEIAYFEEIKDSSIHIIDSVRIKAGGKIKFTVPLEIPGFYQLRLKSGKVLTLLLSPGERVNIRADNAKFFETKTIEGFQNTKRLSMIDDSLRAVNYKLIKIDALYDSLKTSTENRSIADSLSKLYSQIMDNHKKYSIKFILEDLKSLSNVEAIYQQYYSGIYVFNSTKDLQFYKLVSDTLTKYYPKVEWVRMLNNNYNTMLLDLQKEKLFQIVRNADNHVPDLRLTGKKGNLISLSSLRGKIILLTIWSVNQPESIDNLNGLKKVYQKYHSSGFEIYQISIDKSLPEWKKALAIYEITWTSVCDTAFPNSKTRTLYNINSLPMNYLINKDQTDILAKNISSADLDKKLSVIFK